MPWLLLGCCLILNPTPAPTPHLTVVATRGPMGPARGHLQYSIHDEIALRLELRGYTQPTRGQLHLVMRMALYDAANHLAFSEPAQEGLVQPWPDAPVRISYTWSVPPHTPPGPYRWVCTLREPNQKWEVQEELPIEICPRNFGIVALRLSHDAAGQHPAPPGGTVGQRLYLRFSVIDAQAKDGQVALQNRLEILDPQGQQVWTYETNLPQVAKDKVDGLFFFTLQKAGEFTLRLTSTDQHASRSASVDLPLRVGEP